MYQKLSISDFEPHRPRLVHEVYSGIYETRKLMYTIPLVYVAPHEVSLNSGRFANFTPDMQTHLVPNLSIRKVEVLFESSLRWIGPNVKDDWSFSIQMKNVNAGTSYWSFENRMEAIQFKLALISLASGLAEFDDA